MSFGRSRPFLGLLCLIGFCLVVSSQFAATGGLSNAGLLGDLVLGLFLLAERIFALKSVVCRLPLLSWFRHLKAIVPAHRGKPIEQLTFVCLVSRSWLDK